MQGCLDDNAMAAYVDGVLTPAEVTRVDAHLSSCTTCRQDLSAMALTHSARPPRGEGADLGLVPGDTIGRYVISAEHARGGMGIVSIAFDPELGRNIAIKMLQPDLSAQLLRDEARAMAKLSHPNMVSVYDVGEHEGRLYFAMELVEGVTLRRWLALERPSWRSALRVCIQAGRGLAAAHRAGLVHRDFKPDNVLCGPDDRVRVTDFGLAANVPGGTRLGLGSGFAGTPAYIAPEVWRGDRATARSDQWSFASTLYEALFGAPPFAGSTTDEIRSAIERGELEIPTRVPARVRRAIARGLATDPAARFSSIDALLSELETATRGSKSLWVAGVAVIAVAAVAIYAMQPEREPPCQTPRSLIDGIWNDARSTELQRAFAATGRVHAADSAQRVDDTFDRYSSQWLEAREDACVATRVRGDQSEALLDARVRCLDRRRTELAELVKALAEHATPAIVDKSVQVARDQLVALDTCSATGVEAEMPLPADPVRAAQIRSLDDEIAKLRASLTLVTQTDAAIEQARRFLDRARPLEFPPLTARASVALARLGQYTSDTAATERMLYDALVATAAAKDDRASAEIWTYLVQFSANHKGDVADTLALIKPAEAALARVESSGRMRAQLHHAQAIALTRSGDLEAARRVLEQARREATDAIDRAPIDIVQCHVEQQLGKMPAARELCARAVATYERELGPHYPELGFALMGFALLAFELQDNAVARTGFERTLAILENTVGQTHIAYAMALNNLGMIDGREGKHDEARRHYERAIALFDRLKHPQVFSALANLGELEQKLGHYDKARVNLERALGVAEATFGKDSDQVAQVAYSLGSVAYDADDLEAAQAHYERSLAIAVKRFGEQHQRTALALGGLGLVVAQRGDHARAMAYQRRAAAAYEAVYGGDAPSVADALTMLGRAQFELGDRGAIETFERALAIRERTPADDDFQAGGTKWFAAQALWKHGDKARAVMLAREGRALYAKTSDEQAKASVLADIDRWLASHHVSSR